MALTGALGDGGSPFSGNGAHPSPLQGAFRKTLGRIEDIKGVAGAIIASRDGLLVAGGSSPIERLEMKAAFAAAIFGAVDRAAANIDLGPVRATLVETPTRSLQILSFADLLLIVVADKEANMAQVRAGIAKAAAELLQHA